MAYIVVACRWTSQWVQSMVSAMHFKHHYLVTCIVMGYMVMAYIVMTYIGMVTHFRHHLVAYKLWNIRSWPIYVWPST